MKVSNIESKGRLTSTPFPTLALVLGLSASISGYADEEMNITGARVEPLMLYAEADKNTEPTPLSGTTCRYPMRVTEHKKGWLKVEQGECVRWVRKFHAITDIKHKVAAIGGCAEHVTGGIGGVRGMDEGCKGK
jgi:hypothetical protein